MFQLRWVWKNLKGYRAIYVFGLFLVMVGVGFTLLNPMITKEIVDKVIVGVPGPGGEVVRSLNLLLPLIVTMIAAQVLRTVTMYSMIMINETASQGIIYNLRNKLYENMQIQDMNFYDRNRTGDLMTRLTGDMDLIRHTVAWIIRNLFESLLLFVGTTIYFFTIDWLFTLSLIAITPVIFVVTKRFSKKVRPLYVDQRECFSQLNTAAQENIAGNRVVKAFAQEEFEKEKFDQRNDDYRKANLKATFTWLRYYPVIESLAQLLTVITLLLGGYFIIIGRLTVGELTAFSALTWTLSNPMRNLGMLLNDLQRFFASCSKVIELYYSHPTIVNRFGCKGKEGRFDGAVEFDHVSLQFGKEEVLHDISFEARPGETIAIMGNTGSGKTSLINLIARLYDVSDGEVRVDGRDVRYWDLHDLRHNIGIATQDVFLFSDTVDGNIAYGDPEMSEADVHEFANLAAADFIYKMEDGFDTLIGERGVGLSGGQKQRIALARALAVRPAILILDDTTSAVDMETEKHIQHSLRTLDFSCTKFIIAQRISTTKSADKIIVLHDGRIAEMGTHDELVANRGFYYEIYRLQNEGADLSALS